MNIQDLEIKPAKDYKEIPFDLLLSADPSRENILKYIQRSTVFKAMLNGDIIGCYVLFSHDESAVEIKNIAVNDRFQGNGIGTRLLRHAIERSKENKFKRIIIGTGNSSLRQLYLYQKAGFRITQIRPDFFVENYEEEIWENGLQCRDMLILTMEI